MQIKELKTFIVGNPPPHQGGRYFIFVKLVTNDGIEGFGECYVATFSPKTVVAMIEDVFARYVEGQDPHHIEAIWHRVYGSGFSHRPDVSIMGVFSGLEMAMWDIVGKAANKPVYELLGGRVHERLRTYTYLYPKDGSAHADHPVYTDPDAAAERALQEVEAGFSAVKFDPAGPYTSFDGHQPSMADLDRSEQFCKRIREAVGNRADILFGTHGQFTASGAIRMGRRLEAYDPLWFEEPIPPDNPAEMARVARQCRIPVATGERLTSKAEFRELLTHQAASILQMNSGRVGGILEGKKIASMAETFHVQIAPHLYCGPLVAAANIQIAACTPNFLILEAIRDFQGFHGTLLKVSIQWENGYVIPSNEPGLGVELNEEVAAAHPYDGDGLHIMMKQAPFDIEPGKASGSW